MKNSIHQKLINILISILISGSSVVLWAGGVSDGGGNVTSPSNEGFTMDWISESVIRDSAPMIVSLLYTEKGCIFYGPSNKCDTPFKKLFESGINIYDLLSRVRIELKVKEPCFDNQGNPRDGSIGLQGSNEICISPYSMFYKLNQNNFRYETAALVLHEISHLVGTSEIEADAIQRWAISEFSNWDSNKIIGESILIPQEIDILQLKLEGLAQFSELHKKEDIENVISENNSLLQSRMSRDSGPRFIDPSSFELMTSSLALLETSYLSLCLSNPNETPDVKSECNNKIQKAFFGENRISAAVYGYRIYGYYHTEPFWNQIYIENPMTLEAYQKNIIVFREILNQLKKDVVFLRDLRFSVNKK